MSRVEGVSPLPRPLSRVLGLVFGLAVVVGGVIGSGIMRAPGVVAQGLKTEPLILLVWALGGGLAMLTAMPLVEAGSSVPRAGGAYPIAARAFGPTIGFLTGWLAWLPTAASSAYISIVFGEYVHRLGVAGGVPTGVVASGLIILVGGLNWTGTRISGASQSVASALKGGAFLLLAAVLFASPRSHATLTPHPGLAVAAGGGAVVMAIRVIYQTYAGWEAPIYFSEEVRRPDRNIARATFLGIALVTVIYLLVNAAVLHVLTPTQMAGSELAVGDAAKVSLGPVGDTAITVIGLFSLAAICNLQLMSSSRITFRMARDGVAPAGLGEVAPGGTPRGSVALLAAAAVGFALSGSYEQIIKVDAPWTMAGILMICLSAIKLRLSRPDLPRPWRMPLFPWISIGAGAIQAALIVLVVWDDPVMGLISLGVVAAPLPVYFMFRNQWRRQSAERWGPGDLFGDTRL